MIPPDHFNADYYRRYYQDPRTAVTTPAMQRNEVAFVLAFCRHVGLKIERFADVGAGTGWWAREFSKRYPKCRVIETFDASRVACELYGHKHATIQKLTGRPADLVVCRDVLRYLPDSQVDKAIRKLAAKCRGALYLQVITSDDDIDEEASDMKGHFRSAASYRRRLHDAGFADCGMGLYVSQTFEDFSAFAMEVR